jgi:hypothetical protein
MSIAEYEQATRRHKESVKEEVCIDSAYHRNMSEDWKSMVQGTTDTPLAQHPDRYQIAYEARLCSWHAQESVAFRGMNILLYLFDDHSLPSAILPSQHRFYIKTPQVSFQAQIGS